MQCQCGGSTKRADLRREDYRLVYQRCGACERVGGDSLYWRGQRIETGPRSRNRFFQTKEIKEQACLL